MGIERKPLPPGYRGLGSLGVGITSDAAENRRRIGGRPVTDEGARHTAIAIAAVTGHLGPETGAVADARLAEAATYGPMAVIDKHVPRTANGGVDFEALCGALEKAGLEPMEDSPQQGDTYTLHGNTHVVPRR